MPIPSEGPAGKSPRGNTCSAQEMARNDHSSTNQWEVKSKMGDLSSQDSIRRAMVAEMQSLQEQRDNMQAAYEAGSIEKDDDDTH